MTLLKSLPERHVPRQLQPDSIDVILTRVGVYSRVSIVLTVIWFVANRPFWRHLFVALWAMAFETMMLPAEMMFFVRHPVLALAVLSAASFLATNLGRTDIESRRTRGQVFGFSSISLLPDRRSPLHQPASHVLARVARAAATRRTSRCRRTVSVEIVASRSSTIDQGDPAQRRHGLVQTAAT
jgi:hypothetical protein